MIPLVEGSQYSPITFPISFADSLFSITGNDEASAGNPLLLSFYDITQSNCQVYGVRPNDPSVAGNYGRWIAVGR